MSRTEPPPSPFRLVLVGGGELVAPYLRQLREIDPDSRFLHVVGLCTDDPAAIELAAGLDAPRVGGCLTDALPPGGADLIVDLRDVARPGTGLEAPTGTRILGPPVVDLLRHVLDFATRDRRAHAEKHAELLDLQIKLKHFMEFAPFAIYMKDVGLRYQAINRVGADMLSRSPADFIGRTDFDLFPATVARRIQKFEMEVLNKSRTVKFDGVLPLPGDARIYFSATLIPILRDEKPIGLYGLIEDITELHTSERQIVRQRMQITETREYLQGILRYSQDMIFLCRPDGTLIAFNEAAERITGYAQDEVLGRQVQDLAARRDELAALLEETLAEGHAVLYELKLKRRDGMDIVTNLSLTKISGRDNQPLEVVGICRDITKRLQLQEDLIQSERLAAIGKMAAGVAHEINNPLAIIETVAGLIKETLAEVCHDLDGMTRDKFRGYIDKLLFQTKRCTTITHNLLGFARKSSGAQTPVTVMDLLDEAVELLHPHTHRIGLEVHRHYAADLPTLKIDPMLLEQIFVNLLTNAIDAIEERHPPQPRIDLSVSMAERAEGEDARLAVTIKDNGVGIPEENLRQIFELFYTSKPAGKGTGLGLSIVHNILQKIGGEIRAASDAAGGSSFTLLLPLQPPAEPTDRAPL
ncbi:PAS domain-containing protein [bacterium]|nr:PAS domain-containing protein [bacterium]MBU1072245.1 PAS domain-containing protein [bacterium]MBU1674383.1 PAS domain-containing protein [bacterium]